MQAFLYQRLAFLLTSRFAEFRLSVIVIGFVSQSNAQLNVTSQIEKPSEEVGTIRMMSIYLKYSDGLGYFLTIDTDNRFDGAMIFCLGNNAESAIATVNDMISLIDKHIASTEVKQGSSIFTLSNYKFAKNYLYFQQKGYAGDNAMSKKELEKIIKKIKEKEKL